MLRQLRPRSVYDVMAAIACLAALAGGTAYAANTIGTGDIIDDQVTSADVRDDNLGFGGLAAQDLGPGSLGTSEVANSSLAGTDIQNGSLTGIDIASSTLKRRRRHKQLAHRRRHQRVDPQPALNLHHGHLRRPAGCRDVAT